MRYSGLHHIGLYVRDMEKSLSFYTEGLGGRVTLTFPMGDSGKIIALVELAPGAVIELLPKGDRFADENYPWAHIALATDDARKAYHDALQAGAESRHEPGQGTANGMEIVNAFVTGPDGEVIEFFETVAKRKFGIVGGIGPASTVDYYSGLVARYTSRSESYPKIAIESIDMNQMLKNFQKSDYDAVCDQIVGALYNLKNAGAECAAIASNTPHILFDRIREKSPLPLISIVDATCDYMEAKGYRNVLVLGTGFTMRSGMYEAALQRRGIRATAPGEADIDRLHAIIFPNLENGLVIPEDKEKMIEITERYIAAEKIDAVILGCTEIPLMIKEGDLSVPSVNTTEIHIAAIAAYMTKDFA